MIGQKQSWGAVSEFNLDANDLHRDKHAAPRREKQDVAFAGTRK